MPPRLGSNIKKTSAGTYEVRIMKNGRWIRRRFKTAAAAKQFRNALLADRALTKAGMKSLVIHRATITDLIDRYLVDAAARSVAPKTLRHYQQCLRGPKEAWGSRVATSITNSDIARYLTWRPTAYAKRNKEGAIIRQASEIQVRNDLRILVQAYKWARVDPEWRMPKLKRRGRGKRVLELDQVHDLLEAMPAGSLERTMGELASWTGIRDSDLRALTWKDLDLEARTVRIIESKTSKVHELPLIDRVIAHLEAWRRGSKVLHKTLVFHIQGRRLGETSLRKRLAKHCKAAGIDPPIPSFASLRNAVSKYLLDALKDPYAARNWLGHADIRTTLGYAERGDRAAQAAETASTIEALATRKTADEKSVGRNDRDPGKK